MDRTLSRRETWGGLIRSGIQAGDSGKNIKKKLEKKFKKLRKNLKKSLKKVEKKLKKIEKKLRKS